MNLLFITADQWRAECIGALGHPCLVTPTLDRLLAEGVGFLRHHAQATPCGPSRASLHTGLYALNHRSITNGTPLDRRHTHLAAELRKLGRTPVLFGYTDTSLDPRGLHPNDTRLRTFEGTFAEWEVAQPLGEDMAGWLAWLEEQGYGRLRLGDLYGGPLGAPLRVRPEHSETAFLTTRFLGWLARQEAPWTAHVSFIHPHPPLVAAEPFHRAVHPDDVPAPRRRATPDEEGALHPWLAAQLAMPLPSGWWNKPDPRNDDAIRLARAVYYGLIMQLDAELGRIVAALEARGELDDTLIVLTGDHGEMLGDHWLWGKTGFFRQAFHVPLIVRDPAHRTAAGRRVRAFSEHVDLLPTILERLGGEVPLQCDGRSLVPWLAGQTPEGWRRATHYEHDFRDVETSEFERALDLRGNRCQLAVHHSDGFAYVHFNGLAPLAFDLAADPDQFVDVAGDPARAVEVLAAAQAMLDWRMDAAERRLTGAKLTAQGVIGRYE
ncbi:MAG: alkaline phosphatase family protein [Pseudomonadota bacterium]